MLETGIKGHKEIVVTDEMTARKMGSGTLDVYATPCMIALMENTAFESVSAELEAGSGTVGTALNVKHVASTPVGMKVMMKPDSSERESTRDLLFLRINFRQRQMLN